MLSKWTSSISANRLATAIELRSHLLQWRLITFQWRERSFLTDGRRAERALTLKT